MKSWLILSIVTLVSAGEQLSTSDQFYRNPTVHIFEHPLQVESSTSPAALGSSNDFYLNTYKSKASNDSSLEANFSHLDQQQSPLGSYFTLVTEQNPSHETYSQPISNQDFNLTNLSVNGSSFRVYDSLAIPISTNASYHGTYTSPVTNNPVNTNNSYTTKYSDTTYSSDSASSKPVSKFDSNYKTHSNIVKKHGFVSDFASSTNYRLDAPTDLGTNYGSFPNAFPLIYNSFPAKYISPSYVSRSTTYFSPGIKYVPVPYSATVTTYEAPSAVFSTHTQKYGSSFHYSKPVITDFRSNVFSKSADSTSFPKTYLNTVLDSSRPTTFSTPATPASYFTTYSTPATPTSYFTASTSPTTPASNLKTYTVSSTPASFSTVYSTPASSTSYFEHTTPAPPIYYHTTSKSLEFLPNSYSTVATGQDSSSSIFQPVTPRKISSVTVLNPDTTYSSASYVEPKIAYEPSTGINITPSTPALESTTYSTRNAANNSFYTIYSKPVSHSSYTRTYSVPFSILSRTNSIPVTHVTRLSGYSTSETPISDETVYSTPVPISYSTVYSTPVSHVMPVNTHFLNPIAYSKIVDNQVPLRPVYSVPVSSSESSSFNAGPRTSYGSSSIYSLYPPSAFTYTVQRAPVTKEYHTLETPIESSWKTINTWNVLPEQRLIHA